MISLHKKKHTERTGGFLMDKSFNNDCNVLMQLFRTMGTIDILYRDMTLNEFNVSIVINNVYQTSRLS